MDYSHIQKPELDYRYEFTLEELDAAQYCVEAHGFAIVKNVLSNELVNELQESVKKVLDPDGTLGEGNSYTHTSFIEHAPALWKLFDHEPFMRAQRVFCQSEELTINRTAAILRNPGSDPAKLAHRLLRLLRRPSYFRRRHTEPRPLALRPLVLYHRLPSQAWWAGRNRKFTCRRMGRARRVPANPRPALLPSDRDRTPKSRGLRRARACAPLHRAGR